MRSMVLLRLWGGGRWVWGWAGGVRVARRRGQLAPAEYTARQAVSPNTSLKLMTAYYCK